MDKSTTTTTPGEENQDTKKITPARLAAIQRVLDWAEGRNLAELKEALRLRNATAPQDKNGADIIAAKLCLQDVRAEYQGREAADKLLDQIEKDAQDAGVGAPTCHARCVDEAAGKFINQILEILEAAPSAQARDGAQPPPEHDFTDLDGSLTYEERTIRSFFGLMRGNVTQTVATQWVENDWRHWVNRIGECADDVSHWLDDEVAPTEVADHCARLSVYAMILADKYRLHVMKQVSDKENMRREKLKTIAKRHVEKSRFLKELHDESAITNVDRSNIYSRIRSADLWRAKECGFTEVEFDAAIKAEEGAP